MSNAMIASGKDALLGADVDLLVDNIAFDLGDAGTYTPNPATETFRTPWAGAVGSTTANLGSKSLTSGVFDAADTLFPSVPNATSYEWIMLYFNTGVDATAQGLVFLDIQTGLPITGNGNDVDYLLDGGANKIFNWSG